MGTSLLAARSADNQPSSGFSPAAKGSSTPHLAARKGAPKATWRAFYGGGSDEIEFRRFGEFGDVRSYPARVDRGRLHGSFDVFLVSMNTQQKKCAGYSVSIPETVRGRANRHDLDGRITVLRVTDSAGRECDLEFYRMRPDDDLVEALETHCEESSTDPNAFPPPAVPEIRATPQPKSKKEQRHVPRKRVKVPVPASRRSAEAARPGRDGAEGHQGREVVHRSEGDGLAGEGNRQGRPERSGELTFEELEEAFQ